jgi:tetraacyldisaccharide 4'-kinase
MLKTPKFWTQKSLISLMLLPLSALYFVGFMIAKMTSRPQKISKPIICVGNIIAGGSGKTPTAIALGKILNQMGVKFAYLSRGYMNDGSKFLMLQKHDNLKAEQTGDEPLLLLETAPTFVAKDRVFGAKQIESMTQFEAIVLDDGMQSNKIVRDYTIMVVDGKIGFGNGLLIPAGPMRETVSQGLRKADLIVTIGEENHELSKRFLGKKVVNGQIKITNFEIFREKKLIAFCGLAYPQKFFDLIKKSDLELIEELSFADHHRYKIDQLNSLLKTAEQKNAQLVTTKKDWVKFPKKYQQKIPYLDIELRFDNEILLKNELAKIIKN